MPYRSSGARLGFGIFHFDANMTRQTGGTGRVAAYENNYNITTPLFQANIEGLMPIMLFDLLSTSTVGPSIESLLDCAQELDDQDDNSCNQQWGSCNYGMIPCSYTTIISDEPLVNIGIPIFPSRGKNQVTGIISTVLTSWSAALRGVLPAYLKGIRAVVSSSDGGDPYTYKFENGIPIFLGRGALYHPSLHEYSHSIHLNDISKAAALSIEYKLTLTPTGETFDDFYTANCNTSDGKKNEIYLFTGRGTRGHSNPAILELKRRFVRFVSHEIRTPLNTCCMELELLKAEMEDFSTALLSKPSSDEQLGLRTTNGSEEYDTTKTKLDEWLDIMGDVMDNCRNSVSVLNDILSYDKIEACTLHLEMEPINLWEITNRKTVAEFQIQAKNSQIDLQVVSSTTTAYQSPEERAYCILGDNVRLQQVLRNLISNALKFSPAQHCVVVSIDSKVFDCSSKNNDLNKIHHAADNNNTASLSSLNKSSRTQDESECCEACSLPRCGSIEISVAMKALA